MKNRAILIPAILAAFCAWPLAAQVAAPPSAAVSTSNSPTAKPVPVTTNVADAEPIELTPFEVSATKDTGYQATETLAGTRIRTELRDVGAAISVATKEFLQDIGATDSGTLLQYTTNTEVAGTRSTYLGLGSGVTLDESANLRAPAGAQRIRGLAAGDNARDYFVTDVPWDIFNTERVETLRGPNSILFGLGSPAGIINSGLHSAEFRNFGSTDLRIGSYGTKRASLDVNQQLIPGMLTARIDALWKDQKYEQEQAFQNDKRIYGALRYDPQLFKDRSNRTVIKVNFEHGDINKDLPRTLAPSDSISAWWRPTAVSASNPFGGMGQTSINNPYDPYRTDTVVAGNGLGTSNNTTVNYQPYLNDNANQQQPIWFMDGTTNQLYQAYGGYINNGAKDSNGNFTGISSGIQGKRQNGMFYGVGALPGAVTNYNTANSAVFSDASYGQYRTMSLQDPSIFNFYKTLIDGPTKSEWENWNTYNLDLSQTAFNDRLGLQLSYDRQKYHSGNEALLGYNPTISMDITKNLADYYVSGANGLTVTNPNYGRAFVTSGAGSGRSFYTDREYKRASLFGELRAADFTKSEFLAKLLGKHRFNAVAANEQYFNENRTWQMYANSQAWAGYWNGNAGNSSAFNDRAPVGIIYLGSSIIGRSAASGAGIPGITAPVTYQNAGVRVMDSTWQNYGTSYGAAWAVPANLQTVYNPTSAITQSSNPANYLGWTNFQDNLVRYNDGQDNSLLTLAQKSLRQTMSYAGSYQGYFWNNAVVSTLGWRYDEVKTKDVTAQQQSLNRGILNIQPDVYKLPDIFPASQIFKDHSTSGGMVVHLNNLLSRDPLPFNVSLSYNESSNFQVTSVRRDLYGNPFGNPAGKTYEYGALLSTKDGKYSLRVVNYTTRVKNGSAQLSNAGGLAGIIQQGLRWRNVFLYQLGGYDWASRDQPSYRNTWTNYYSSLTAAQAQAAQDSAITTWNNIQKALDAKGFFQAWNFTPTTASKLVDRTTYLSNPAAYAPDPATVSSYVAVAPQGFTVTADTESKGNEFELTANPTSSWRLSFNASKATAVRNNVGGSSISQFVSYIDSQLYNADGTPTPAGQMTQFGSSPLASSTWGPWRANYVAMKLQEGSSAPEIRKMRYNITSNYTFQQGILKNLGVGAAYHWTDKVVIGYPVKTGGSFDLSQPYYGPAEDSVDLWASYSRKITEKINWKIQLNVSNVGAKDGLLPVSVEPDGKTWASVRTKPIQEWSLANTFSF